MNATAKWLEVLTNASFLYGPFFFAILFMLVVTRMAHSYYKSVNQRTTPPASPEEKKTYRLFFIASISVGIVLVFTAVGWWIYAQLQTHTLEGTIAGLDTSQTIITVEDDVYLRTVERDVGSGVRMKDYHFAIVRGSPFVTGQQFRFGFFPEQGSIGPQKPEPVELLVSYSGRAREKFLLRKSGNTFILVSCD
jgi:hypothetical protein